MFTRVKTKRDARVWLVHLAVCGAVSVPIALSMGAPSGVAENLEFRGELSYTEFEAAAASHKSVRIKRSPGGTGAAAMMLGRVKQLVIDGPCNSACAWAFVRHANACFTARASFGFHGAHDPGTGRRMPVATNYWLSTVREPLRERLQGLLKSSRVIRLRAKDMRRYYGDRACGAAPSATVVAERVQLPVKKPVLSFATADDEAGAADKIQKIRKASLSD